MAAQDCMVAVFAPSYRVFVSAVKADAMALGVHNGKRMATSGIVRYRAKGRTAYYTYIPNEEALFGASDLRHDRAIVAPGASRELLAQARTRWPSLPGLEGPC
ncbi:MAG: hypothetical protein IT285_16160 [Bdellovibrionales bacterium]|nr:hypothetical protein [Bdellovibrionales bacterium]